MMPKQFETQQLWDWRAAAYLFLAGTGAGSTLTAVVYAFLFDSYSTFTAVGMILGPLLAILGSLFLLLDLGRPALSYMAPRRPAGSWISRGFLILTAFILLGVISSALWIWPWQVIEAGSTPWWIIAALNGIFALLTVLYSALLLGTSPIPFWNTPALPVLFFVSSVSTGSAAIVLMTVHLLRLNVFLDEPLFWAQNAGTLTVLEMILVGLYLYGMKLVTAARASVTTVVRGRLAASFWIGFVGVGLVVPLVCEWTADLTLLQTVCTLVGGYLLRSIVVSAGIKIPLSAQGVVIPIPGRN